MNTVDLDVLGKLLCLAKSFDDAFRDDPKSRAIDRVLIRTTPSGNLTFQAKGGNLWRFVTITLSGREKEYDLGKNFSNLQNLFATLSAQSESEIRRAAQGMAMYRETVIDTQDAVLTLRSLEQTLNSLIDLIIAKKLRRQSDDERKKSIKSALEAMKIRFEPQNRAESSLAKESKRQSKKKINNANPFDEAYGALQAKIVAKEGHPHEASYLRGRLIALDKCKKELMLWLEGTSLPTKELLAFGNVKNLLNEWDRATPELSQLKQQAQDDRHRLQKAHRSVQERIQKLKLTSETKTQATRVEAIEEKILKLLNEESDELFELFRRAGEHYLVDSQQFQQSLNDLIHILANRKKLTQDLVKRASLIEKETQKPENVRNENLTTK